MNVQRGWKVAHYSERLNEYTSAVQVGEAEIVYSSEWAKPNKGCGPLCVFASQSLAWEHMREIRHWYNNLCIVECEYVESGVDGVWNDTDSYGLSELPPGTVLADRVRLIL